jgi:cytochrome oxidase assembly protein ShyY1
VLLRPRWLAGHVLVLAVVATFASLGFWQLDRRSDEQRAERDARAASEQISGPDVGTVTEADVQERPRIRAMGHYDPDRTVFVRDRVRGDAIGVGVLTPLVLDDGRAVLVDRGFLPGDPVAAERHAEPPAGTVEVSGTARLPQEVQGGESSTPTGDPPAVDRVDPGALGDDLLPVWITLEAQRPEPAPDGPVPAVATTGDDSGGYEVNHLSYALQWFGLALVPLVGWPILLRRAARKERATRSGRPDGRPRRAGGGTR